MNEKQEKEEAEKPAKSINMQNTCTNQMKSNAANSHCHWWPDGLMGSTEEQAKANQGLVSGLCSLRAEPINNNNIAKGRPAEHVESREPTQCNIFLMERFQISQAITKPGYVGIVGTS